MLNDYRQIRNNNKNWQDSIVDNQRIVYAIPVEKGYGLSLSTKERIIRTTYRIVELCVGVSALLLTLPLMLVIALIIKLDSPGPALFFQQRCSRSKLKSGSKVLEQGTYTINDQNFSPEKKYWVPHVFWFVKFRTMYSDARERFPELYNYNYSEEELKHIAFKVYNDPRVTRVGKWLRESTLDELPNFLNLLIGEMRIVGPRPEIYEMLHNYRPDQMCKFTVAPGLTGFPQIKGRGRLSFQDTVGFDLEYVEKKSVFLDLKIIIITAWKIIKRDGAF